MPVFTYVSDLPPQVRENLDIPLQQLWLDTYTQVYNLVGNEVDASQTAWLKVFQAAFPGEIADVTTQQLPQTMPPPQPNIQPGASVSAVAPFLSEPKAYWVDLGKYQFEEGQTTWIQAFPVGKYQHPRYGLIDVTPEKVQRMALNVNNRVRGQDLDIDYDHKEKTNEAAGWVKAAEARNDGLWLAVEWTKTALQKLKEKAYRYFSPEYTDEWTDNQNRKWQDVIFGGALTNRPFLKNILPINLSEVIPHSEGNPMNKELLAILGLPEDANEDAVKDALTKLKEGEGKPDPKTETETETDTKEPVTVGLSEEIKKLAEDNPLVKGLVDRVAILETANRMSEVDSKLSGLVGEDKLIAPAQLSEFRDTILELPSEQGNKVLDALSKIKIVELTERGRTTTESGGNEGVGGATKKFTEAIDARVKAGESYDVAAANVASEQPELFEEYQTETYIREKGAK